MKRRLSAAFIEEALKQGMPEKDIHEIVIDVFEAAFELKLRGEDTRGVFLALNQMVIKKKAF